MRSTRTALGSLWVRAGVGAAGGAGAVGPFLSSPLPAGGLHYQLTEGDIICVFSQ